MAIRELNIETPIFKRRISALEVMNGAVISPMDRVALMSDDEYENKFIVEWLTAYLAERYERVRCFAGAGDKGRDVVGYFPSGEIDIYQCKHYDSRIAPSNINVELAKICHYTFNNVYPIPKSYYIVAPLGCGPSLLDLIAKPENFNKQLIESWDTQCRQKIITTSAVDLIGDFKKYVEEFNFSIVKDIAPHELIEQHKKTPFHTIRFGGGLRKFRDVIPKPDDEIQVREEKYTTQLFELYTEKLRTPISNRQHLHNAAIPQLIQHFNQQRNSFYSAESLEKFSRENFPEANPLPFDELKDDAEIVLMPVLDIHHDKNGYDRLLNSLLEIQRQNFEGNALSNEIKPIDKQGLCHHLANEERLNWIIK